MAEAGFPGFEALNWYGYLGPANMPKDVVERLNREHRARRSPIPKPSRSSNKTGVEPQSDARRPSSRKYIEREYQTWGKLVKEAGIKAE